MVRMLLWHHGVPVTVSVKSKFYTEIFISYPFFKTFCPKIWEIKKAYMGYRRLKEVFLQLHHLPLCLEFLLKSYGYRI